MSERDTILLRDVAGVPDSVAESLAGLGFLDATQLLGAVDVQGVGLHLAEALGITDADLAEVVEGARRVASLSGIAGGGGAGPGAFGALPPGPAITAEIATLQAPVAAPPVVPPAVNLIGQMPPIRDQGSRGTCVAFALSAVHEHHRRLLGQQEDLSEQFLYHETKRIDGAPGSCGTWQVKALQVLSTLGECREHVWAYNSAPPCNQNGVPPTAAKPDAAPRTCKPVVLGPKDVQGAKSLLASGRILGFSVPVYSSWANSIAVHLTGRITMRLAGEAVIAGHAMCLVGYQDNPDYPGGGYFILRNSWGTQWAASSAYGPGYGTIPYAYIGNDGWELVSVA